MPVSDSDSNQGWINNTTIYYGGILRMNCAVSQHEERVHCPPRSFRSSDCATTSRLPGQTQAHVWWM